jgi:hypothetical protein
MMGSRKQRGQRRKEQTVSSWAERHRVDVDDEVEVSEADLFDERQTGWSRYESDVDFIDDEGEDECRDREVR